MEKNKRKLTNVDIRIGAWLSAALEDNTSCEEFRKDINEWMDSFDYESTDFGMRFQGKIEEKNGMKIITEIDNLISFGIIPKE